MLLRLKKGLREHSSIRGNYFLSHTRWLLQVLNLPQSQQDFTVTVLVKKTASLLLLVGFTQGINKVAFSYSISDNNPTAAKNGE